MLIELKFYPILRGSLYKCKIVSIQYAARITFVAITYKIRHPCIYIHKFNYSTTVSIGYYYIYINIIINLRIFLLLYLSAYQNCYRDKYVVVQVASSHFNSEVRVVAITNNQYSDNNCIRLFA